FVLFFIQRAPPPATHPLSLHDALPISTTTRPCASGELWSTSSKESSFASAGLEINHCSSLRTRLSAGVCAARSIARAGAGLAPPDRKSTRLNSSHEWISYAVFCLKKKK